MRSLLLIVALLACNLLPAQVTIKGAVKHAEDSVIVFVETGGFTNITRTWRDKRYKAKIDKNKRFVITLPEEDINRWLIKTKKGYQFFDLVKGKDIEVVADFSRANPLTATGSNAGDFNYLTYAARKDKRDKAYRNGIRSKNMDSVLLLKKQIAAMDIATLDHYKQTHNMSQVYYNWIRSRYRYEPYERICVENIDSTGAITDAMLSRLTEEGIDNDYAALNTLEYNDLVDVYMGKKFMDAGIIYTPQAYLQFATGGLLQGKTRDVYLTRVVCLFVKADDSIYNPIYDQYNTIVKDEHIKHYVIKEREAHLGSLQQKRAHISQYASLNEIFNKYRGKLIYIDFWASWCIPCRVEMPAAAELKKRLHNDNIVFVYLGYKDKEGPWLKARQDLDIEGEHYLLNDTLVKEAEEAFNINGIPHYVIIDKAGNIVNSRADRPHAVYNELSKLLEKN
ncbi:MAG TPA: TlpA disulfide reductase family protein [Agriterribacter sp.]|nr:TlpA disulfide reductase family protein [Agriterribacter sp.]